MRTKPPLFSNPISAGFPSPCEDYLETMLDLNEHLVQKPAATFFLRVKGSSMLGAGIHHGDLLIVDRSRQACSGHVVVAAINGELTVKRLEKKGNALFLRPENPTFHPIEIKDGMEFYIWGVVIHSIHTLTQNS